MDKPLILNGIDLNQDRTIDEGCALILHGLKELEQITDKELDFRFETNKQYVRDNIKSIKRVYEKIEKKFIEEHQAEQNDHIQNRLRQGVL